MDQNLGTLILTAGRQEPKPLAVPMPDYPEFDKKLFVRRHSSQVSEYALDAPADDHNERARYVALVTCDENGLRIFTDADALALGNSAYLGPLVESLYWAGRHHNGLTTENREAYRKNSPAGAADGLPLCSPSSPAPPPSI